MSLQFSIKCELRAQVARHFDQAIGVRTVLRSDDQQQVGIGGHVLDRNLAIFGGVADVLRGGPLMLGNFISQRVDDVAWSRRG